jgi:hypothetical protein
MKIIQKLLFTSLVDNAQEDRDLEELDRVFNNGVISKQYDLTDYASIVHSSKYADSHADTKQLEKLLALIDIKNNGQKAEDELQENDDNKYDDKATREKDSTNIKAIEAIICREADDILPGQPCYKPAKFGIKGGVNFTLRKFDIPKWIFTAIHNNNVDHLGVATPLMMDNYIQRFQTLMWVEEAQQQIEMRKYDMYDVLLGKHEDFFVIEVPGLAEGRPSLLRGDRLIVRSEHRGEQNEGYIYEVREKDILFKLHETLHSASQDGLRYIVQFLSSRTPFRRCHHAVLQYKEMPGLRHLIFPFPRDVIPEPLVHVKDLENVEEFPCYNNQLNTYQRRAVMNVLRAQSRPAPYIIFGPPGTGKTVTMVEAILQVYKRAKDFKLLVCANSNSSADILARRIKASGVVKEGELIRVSAFYRMEKLVPPDLEDVTKDTDSIDSYTYEKCRVVVTTCIQAGSLYNYKDKFDFVFIDEAGHASEPEALVPVGLINRGGCCVLAGDPHQLGPICVSRVADQYGLGTSFLERLCRRSIYERNHFKNNRMDYNGRYITKLRICYRCDPRVLSISNKMFYDGDLKFVNKTPDRWLELLKVDNPLIFHCVKGRDRREYTNPSWFNPSESIRCLTYVKRLYDSGLRSDQLGIITPYRRQIDKLNLLFESCNLEKCKIATMEEFQGDERDIIIISTVRTREKKIDFDKKFQLGFLFNPRRFNVAVSRAKWLVIVVGDPQILTRDPYWNSYIETAHNFGDIDNRVQS